MEIIFFSMAVIGYVIWVIIFAFFRTPAYDVLDYDKRWSDQKYIKMVHETMAFEEKELGQSYTICEADCHKVKPAPVPPKGPAVVSNNTLIHKVISSGVISSNEHRILAEQAKKEALDNKIVEYRDKFIDYKKYNTFILKGHEFKIAADKVPDYAHGFWDETSRCGYFMWLDPKTGKRMQLKTFPIPSIEAEWYEIHSVSGDVIRAVYKHH